MREADETERLTYSVDELCELTEWPKLIKAVRPHHGKTEEPLVALGVHHFKRISACAYEQRLQGTASEVIEKSKTSFKFILPVTLSDKGRPICFQIRSLRDADHIYPSIQDLQEYRPRYFKPTKTFVAGDLEVKKGKTLELKEIKENSFLCEQLNVMRTVTIPLSAKGDFKVVEDANRYTLETTQLPQRVLFEKLPPGLPSPDVVLLDEHLSAVLITLPLGCLFHDPTDRKWIKSGNVKFVFLPASTYGLRPLEDCLFYLWDLGSPGSMTQKQMSQRTSHYSSLRFKDSNEVLPVSSGSIQSCAAETVYEYLVLGQLQAQEVPRVYETLDSCNSDAYMEPNSLPSPSIQEDMKTRPLPPVPSEGNGQDIGFMMTKM